MLTDATIRKLPATRADRLIAAGDRSGLYLRVRATGRKTWVIRRRVAGAWHVETLGDWPALTALNARRRAGAAPVPRAALTVRDAIGDFYRTVIEASYREPAAMLPYLQRDLKPLHGRRLDAVTRGDLAELIRAKAAATPNAGAKLLAVTKGLYRWALVGGLVEVDPTVGLTAKTLRMAAPEPRERVLSDDELRDLFALPEEPYGRLLVFALLTATRIGEAIAFEPGQLRGTVWTIPETKNGRPHSLPLSPAAWALATAGWPKRSYEGLHAYFRLKGIPWRPHDLRRTAATRMREAGVSVEVVEAVLNHAPPRLLRTYQRPDMMPAMREALHRLQTAVAAAVGATG